MKTLTYLYLIMYLLHILLGPYFIWYLIFLKKPKWISKDINEILRRSTWITYLSFLVIAYFNEYPNVENFLISLIISVLATIGYYLKYFNSKVFYYGLFDHIIFLIIPVIYLFNFNNLNILDYKPTVLSLLCLIYSFTLTIYDEKTYIGGNDL